MQDLESIQTWLGSEEIAKDRVDLQRVRQLAASLDLEHQRYHSGSILPPLWHWMFATPISALHQAGRDGHTARGGFLPPVPLPRRMWAGSRIAWHGDIYVNEPISRHSTVASIQSKTGRSGSLVFVTVKHLWQSEERLVIEEEHDIVYRDIPQIDSPKPREAVAAKVWPQNLEQAVERATELGQPEVRCRMQADEVLLFRYSALTFNSHKIHYDRRHCIEVEKYPGLIVHGPLMACLMGTLAWMQSGHQRPKYFAFRALSPVFDGEPVDIISRQQSEGPAEELLGSMPAAKEATGGLIADCAIQKEDSSNAMIAQMAW